MTEEDKQFKSEQLAALIEVVKSTSIMMCYDIDFTKEMIKDLRQQANRQESLAVLMPSHSQTKNDLLRVQAGTLDHFNKFIEGLHDCQKLKDRIKGEGVYIPGYTKTPEGKFVKD